MSISLEPATKIVGGNKAVATAGTQVQLTSAVTPCLWVGITAAPANSGSVTVGDANVDATADAENGLSLAAGDTVVLPVNDVSMIWIDAATSGDEVGFLYGTSYD
jgi:hypothetical protein